MNEAGIVIHINRRIKIPCRKLGHVGRRYETLICEEYCVIVSLKYLRYPWM
jgi:hypothetical protein